MDQNQKPGNVIQFPGKRKEENHDQKVASVTPAANVSKRDMSSRKTLFAALVAVMAASGAVNKYVFSVASESLSVASSSQAPVGRGIASVKTMERDARWEKELAEQLASSRNRSIASVNIGRPATQEEKLRWGLLEEKYTITYKTEERAIASILLQGENSEPSYVLDRTKFFSEYGSLFDSSFESAKLKSVESTEQNTIESYVLYDKDNQPKGEVRIELDRHKRLLSLKVDPVQI